MCETVLTKSHSFSKQILFVSLLSPLKILISFSVFFVAKIIF